VGARIISKSSNYSLFFIANIISQTTKERLNALEAEKAELINKIAVEKLKSNLIIQKHDIVKYLQSAVKSDRCK